MQKFGHGKIKREKSFEQIMNEHTNFTLSTFEKATAQSSLTKLSHEVDEVKAAIESNDPNLPEEYADCIMCLLDSAARLGIGANQIRAAFEKKLQKNQARSWIKNEDNTYSHVKH